MSSRKTALLSVLVIMVVGILFQLAIALETDPAGVETITRGVSTTFNASLYNPANTTAEAGNITQLTLSAIGPTRFWQGYYGEITGEIVLEDANGNTLYNWSDTEPQGQIFASIGNTIDWLNVACLDAADEVTWTQQETLYDMAGDDSDGITETFTQNNHPDFYIGENFISGCNTTWTFVNSLTQTARFPMVILEDDTNDVAVFATFIENRDNGNSTDVLGFDNVAHDFQFMVPENGTDNNADLTTYSFWATIQ